MLLCSLVFVLNGRSYAVLVQTGRLTRWKSDLPAAAWYCFILFTNIRTTCECLWTSNR